MIVSPWATRHPQADTPPTVPGQDNVGCTNSWMAASPLAATNFSAVCYLTVKRLAQMSRAPGAQGCYPLSVVTPLILSR